FLTPTMKRSLRTKWKKSPIRIAMVSSLPLSSFRNNETSRRYLPSIILSTLAYWRSWTGRDLSTNCIVNEHEDNAIRDYETERLARGNSNHPKEQYMSKGYIDADGHIIEKAEELIKYLEEPWRMAEPVIPRRLLPTGDDFHTPRIRRKGIFNEAVCPEHSLEYLEKTRVELTILYPTAGLAPGYVINPEWAVVYARAWNNYVFDKYLKKSPQFKAVALIPMQDVSSCVIELRRAVKE